MRGWVCGAGSRRVTYRLALVVVAQQRVGQGTQGREQDPVGDAEGQDHVEVPGQSGEPGPQAKGQVGDEVQGADAQVFLQLLQKSCGPDRGEGATRPVPPGAPARLGCLPRLTLRPEMGDWHGRQLALEQTTRAGPQGAEGLLTAPVGPDGQQDLGRPCSHRPGQAPGSAASEGVFRLKYPRPENVGFPARAPYPCVDHSALSPRTRTPTAQGPAGVHRALTRAQHLSCTRCILSQVTGPLPCVLVPAAVGNQTPSCHPRADKRDSRTLS